MRAEWILRTKPLIFIACLLPATFFTYALFAHQLGADPVAQLEHRSGDWALRFLLLSLAISPLRKVSGLAVLIRLRRMLGLFAFFYASLHFAIYLVIDLGGFWTQVFAEILKRPYITVGFAAWLLMVPMALTSTHAMMRRMGRHWQRLHKVVYAVGLLAVLHYLWQVKYGQKIAVREPLIYLAIFVVLMVWRLPWRHWMDKYLPAELHNADKTPKRLQG